MTTTNGPTRIGGAVRAMQRRQPILATRVSPASQEGIFVATRMRSGGLVALVAIMLLAPACARPGEAPASPGATTPSPFLTSPESSFTTGALGTASTDQATPPPTTGPTDPTAIINSVLSRFDSQTLLSAHIEPATPSGTGNVFIATVSAPSMDNGDFGYAVWMGLSAQGAVAKDLAGAKPLMSVFSDSFIKVQLPDGTTQIGGGGQTKGSSPSVNDSESDVDLTAAAAAVLATYGLRLTSTRVFHPLHAAIAILSQVADEDKIRGNVGKVQEALYNLGLFESMYLEVDSASGQKLSVQTWDLYAGGGMGYNAPGYDYLGTPHG